MAVVLHKTRRNRKPEPSAADSQGGAIAGFPRVLGGGGRRRWSEGAGALPDGSLVFRVLNIAGDIVDEKKTFQSVWEPRASKNSPRVGVGVIETTACFIKSVAVVFHPFRGADEGRGYSPSHAQYDDGAAWASAGFPKVCVRRRHGVLRSFGDEA